MIPRIYNRMGQLLCSADFVQLAREWLVNSGRGIFHLGHYQQCLSNPHMKYSLIELTQDGINMAAFTGLCLPRTCQDHVVRTRFDRIFQTLGLDVKVLLINSETEHYSYPLTWLAYLTIFLLLLAGILVLVASVGKDKDSKPQDQEKKGQIVACFDLAKNIQTVFRVRKQEPLNVWDGVRALAMMWVVIGHHFQMQVDGGPLNLGSVARIAAQPFFLLLQAGFFSVDVFLALGGFFLAFVMIRQQITLKLCGLGLIQRALRIWPAYIITMMFAGSIFLSMGSGPQWSRGEPVVQGCSSMWKDILFVGNFVGNGEHLCIGWGWYLQVDFQLFCLGVLLLYVYSKQRTAFFLTVIFMGIGSSIFVFLYTFFEQVTVITSDKMRQYYINVYRTPYGRCVPYLMGLLLGVLFMEHRKQQKDNPQNKDSLLSKMQTYLHNHKIVRIVIEWLGIGLMAFVAFILRPVQIGHEWPQFLHSLYYSLSKPIFILGMFLTVVPSTLGIPSFFGSLLKNKVLMVIARISFCTYLVHIFILWHFALSRSYDFYYSYEQVFVIYLGLLPLCLFFGFVLTFLVEAPCGNLLAVYFKRRQGRGKNCLDKKESLITNDSLIEKRDDMKRNSIN